MKENIKVIGFDADDTLWINENYFRDTESDFAELFSDYGTKEELIEALYETEVGNLKLLGFGVKPFIVSMIETAIKISKGKVSNEQISKLIEMGKTMLLKPVILLPGVKEVLNQLQNKYKLIVATKGDLLDQESKLQRSSLSSYFHHIEIMSDKKVANYEKLLRHLEIPAENFLMIGNSLKSDILPPYELGAKAIHVPYETTWIHEMNVEDIPENGRYKKVDSLSDVLTLLK